MANEIEKKYLPTDGSKLWEKEVVESEVILQVYLKDEENIPCRIRLHLNLIDNNGNIIKEAHGVRCYKKLVGELEGVPVYDEKETDVDKFIALSLIKENFDTLIMKKRHYIPFHEFTFEVDLYHSYNFWAIKKDVWEFEDNLQTVEIEFKTSDEIKKYNSLEKPKWLGLEITHDHKYKNINLAKREKNDKINDLKLLVNSINLNPNSKVKP